MIGQKEVLKQIDNLIEKGFPRFVVITGQKGQGKTELAIEISKRLKIPFCNISTKIDDVREMINMAYKQTEPIIYLIQNADNMSIGAKNSLLKVIEEPPNNAYFIMELQQMENTLLTIRSRCQEIKLQNYTDTDIEKMIINSKLPITDEEEVIIQEVAQNKYQIDLLIQYNPKVFYSYVDKVVNNIYRVSSANSFKLAEKIDLLGDGEGYDLNLFWETFKNICYERGYQLIENDNEIDNFCSYLDSVRITAKYIHKLKINGINRTMLMDNWILDIRRIWR